MENSNKNQERIYEYSTSCVFRKTKEAFGGLSNMASGFPICVNERKILSSEALYQALRFPENPELQKKILNEKSPMTAKMVSKPFRATQTRLDWDNVRVDIMYWCLRVKLAQNFIPFGRLLESTYNKPIVEDSSKDKFWGAVKDKENEKVLRGVNALGRLLMKLREEFNSEKRYELLVVEPLNIPNFSLFNLPIGVIDERRNFIIHLLDKWKISLDLDATNYKNVEKLNESKIFNEPIQKLTKKKKSSKHKSDTTKSKLLQPELPF